MKLSGNEIVSIYFVRHKRKVGIIFITRLPNNQFTPIFTEDFRKDFKTYARENGCLKKVRTFPTAGDVVEWLQESFTFTVEPVPNLGEIKLYAKISGNNGSRVIHAVSLLQREDFTDRVKAADVPAGVHWAGKAKHFQRLMHEIQRT